MELIIANTAMNKIPILGNHNSFLITKYDAYFSSAEYFCTLNFPRFIPLKLLLVTPVCQTKLLDQCTLHHRRSSSKHSIQRA